MSEFNDEIENAKPCPFCGGYRISVSNFLQGNVAQCQAKCKDCSAASPPVPVSNTRLHIETDALRAIEMWNTRNVATANEAKQSEHRDLYLKVALKCIKYSESCNEFLLYKQNADDITELMLSAAENFKPKEQGDE